MSAGRTGWVRRLSAYVLRHRRDVAISVAAAVSGSALQTLVPLIARQIIDRVIIAGRESLWPWLLALTTAGLLVFVTSFFRRYLGARAALAVQFDLRNEMHDHLQRMDLQNVARMPTGQLVARANSDSALVQALLNFLPIMGGNVLLMVLSLAVMVYLSPLLAVVSLITFPALLVVSYRMRRRVFPATWDAQQREGELAQIVDEDVNGVRVVKAFGQERRELGRLVEAARSLYGARMRSVRLQSRYQPLLEAVPALSQVAILALGGWLALHHEISLGTFLAFSTYIAQFVAPARQLTGVLTIAQQARAGVERIFQLLDLRPAIEETADAVELPVLRGDIVFEDVHFGYEADAPVLRGLDLHLAPGERVAIVGSSGSGKSTLAAFAARMYDPDRGRVLVDGHDLRGVTLRSLRRQVGVAFEEAFLFSDTVRANIAYGRPDATDAEIEAAARAAAAHDFVTALPDGYATRVGERGLTLSGGQRQRIALARTILTDPAILVLDDATSAVDATTEVTIHHALRERLTDRTTLLIAHRMSTLHLADRIVVLDGGRIAASGTHTELTATSPLYRTLLSGLEQDETGQAGQAGDSIEQLAARWSVADGATASAWQVTRRPDRSAKGAGTMAAISAPSLGAGLGGGAGGGWRRNLPATPELLARVESLPPIRDTAAIDIEREARPEPHFSLAGLLRMFRKPLLVGLVLVVLDALAGLAGPVLVKMGVDSGVARHDETVLFMAAGLLLVVTLADLLVSIGETFVTGGAAERIMLSLRVKIWAQLQRLSLDYYEHEMAGRIMTRMTTDVDQFESLIENGLLSALVSLVTFVGVGCALVAVNAELGLWTLTVAVPLAIATVVFRRRSRVLYDLARDRIAMVNAAFQESLAGVRESQAFTHEEETSRGFHALGRDYLRVRIAAQRLVAVYFPFVQFLSACADAVVLGVGARMVASGHLAVGTLIAFLLYVDLFFSPVQQLSQVFDAWQQTRVSVERIGQLMALRTLTPEAPGALVPHRLGGEVRLSGVQFSYPLAPEGLRPRPAGPADPRLARTIRPVAKREALRGVDLHVREGETVALVGETGAGKSTVVKLLSRFYDPDAGSVTIDGHDLRTLDLRAVRSRLGYVPQEAFLFGGTIRHNIAYGRPDATDAQVEAAARAVGAHDFVAGLPGGYLHLLAERGASLSAGQRQLIALARAELVDPAVLLLDEATANLDLATEARVAAAMQQVSGRRTTIVIAHRLQTARSADRIAVFDRGRIIEIGSHDDLLGQNGRYARMWQAYEGASASAADGVLREAGRWNAGEEERVGPPGVASP
ncbi:ABC transporter ATP-binding protein [Streptomyces monashensis]|uniref:ABC transporter ATP-binding protein n=1 Tax=Streptomyces monashensis TaxID=1678012 RepID=UPI0033EDBEC6